VRDRTGIPFVINTSLNRRGEPIAEIPSEALDLVAPSGIDALVFGDDVLVASESMAFDSELQEIRQPSIDNSRLTIESGRTASELEGIAMRQFPYSDILLRSQFGLRSEYFDWLLQGRKITTIRCRFGAIDLPEQWRLPIFRTGVARRSHGPDGVVAITRIDLCRYDELTEQDARRDGFAGLKELVDALEDIYGAISNTTVMTIYHIELQSKRDTAN
jgi:hypothetical protein